MPRWFRFKRRARPTFGDPLQMAYDKVKAELVSLSSSPGVSRLVSWGTRRQRNVLFTTLHIRLPEQPLPRFLQI
jgi:hypothetical protein